MKRQVAPNPRRPASGRRAQRGMVLLVGLILLVILTALSAIGFRNVTLSERMAANAFDRNLAFQAAENSGREAFQIIELNATSTGLPQGTAAYYDHVANPTTAMALNAGTTSYWTQGAGASISTSLCTTVSAFNWSSCAASVPSAYSNNAQPAQYVIARISSTAAGASTVTVYQVTTRSVGGSGGAEVVLQTLYTKSTTP